MAKRNHNWRGEPLFMEHVSSNESRYIAPEKWRKRAHRQFEIEQAKKQLRNFALFVVMTVLIGLVQLQFR